MTPWEFSEILDGKSHMWWCLELSPLPRNFFLFFHPEIIVGHMLPCFVVPKFVPVVVLCCFIVLNTELCVGANMCHDFLKLMLIC